MRIKRYFVPDDISLFMSSDDLMCLLFGHGLERHVGIATTYAMGRAGVYYWNRPTPPDAEFEDVHVTTDKSLRQDSNLEPPA